MNERKGAQFTRAIRKGAFSALLLLCSYFAHETALPPSLHIHADSCASTNQHEYECRVNYTT